MVLCLTIDLFTCGLPSLTPQKVRSLQPGYHLATGSAWWWSLRTFLKILRLSLGMPSNLYVGQWPHTNYVVSHLPPSSHQTIFHFHSHTDQIESVWYLLNSFMWSAKLVWYRLKVQINSPNKYLRNLWLPKKKV